MRLIRLGRISAARVRALAAALAMAVLGAAVVFGAQVTYEYDDLGRLKSASYEDGKQIDYELDAPGNRKTVKTWNAPPVPTINNVLTWSTNGNFLVQWTLPATPVVVTRYELYESLNGGDFSATPLVNSLVTQYSATGRGEGRYYYRVRACSADGCGRYATWTSPFHVDVTPPNPVSGFQATAVGPTTATLGWNVTTDNVGIQDYQYRVLPSQTWISVGTALSANLTGLTTQTEFTAQVRARDLAGSAGTLSSATFTTLRPVPTSPTNLSMNQNANCSWRATWSPVSGATSYVVRETGPAGTEYTTTNTEFYISCPVGDPEANKPKWVKACNDSGCSPKVDFGTSDTQAPTQPGVLTFPSILHNGATVSWPASSDNVGVYLYDYRVNGAGPWVSVFTPTATLTGLSVSTTYNIEVRAMDAVGNLSPIRTGSFTTLATPDTTPPGAPGSPSVSGVQAYQVTVNWTAASDNVGVTGYRFKPTVGSTWTTVGNVLTGTQTGLIPLTQYTIEVQARDAAGNWSASAQTGSFTTLVGVPPQPTGPTMFLQASCSWRADWNASLNATSYIVRDTNGAEQTVTATTANINCPQGDPEANKPKYVKACNASGCSSNADFSPASSGDTTAPSQPGALSFSSVTATSAFVSWGVATDNVAVTSYEYSLNSGNYIVLGNATNVSLTGLTGATTYTFNVRARDAAGNVGTARSQNFATSDLSAPTQPGTITFSAVTATTATAGWVASTDNVGVTAYEWRLNSAATWNTVSTNSASITGLTGSTSYTFEVRARDAAGNLSTSRTATLNTADGSAPTQPGAVTISLVTATTARANWGASTDNVAVTAYDYRLNGGSWLPLANVTQVDMTGLTQNTSYTFEVRARDAAGNVSPTRTASAFTTLDGSAPTQPGTVTISAITATTATATWGASTDNVAVTAYDYRLNAGAWQPLGNVTTVNLSGLTQATVYTFEVRARDAQGNVSVVRTAPNFSTPDVTAPTQPGAVTISLVTATTARASWGASTDNVAVTAYDYRLNGGAWNPLGNVTLVDLTGLAQVTSYTFEVRARDAAGNPSTVRTASAFTTLDGTAPTQPGVVTISAIGGTTATASWGASSDNVAVTGYNYRLNGGGWADAGNVTTLNLTGLAQATTYTFEVQARDAAGNVSVVRTASNFQTLDLTAPTQPASISMDSVSAFSALVSWGPSSDNVAVGSYMWKLSTQAQWTETALTRSAFINGLAQQTSYTVEVRARDNSNNVSPVISTTFTTPIAPPAAPTNLSYNQVADCAWNASWSAVSGATRYDVRDTNGNVQQTTSTSISINCPIGDPNGNKPYWVKACNSGGCSGEAQFGSQGGDQLAPSTPTGLTASNVQPTSATISWNPSSDNVGVAGYHWALNSGGWNGVSATSIGITGLLDNTTHTVYVRAYDAAGNVSSYTQVSFTTPLAPDVTPPSAVPNLRVSGLGSSSTTLAWDAASDNFVIAGYNYRLSPSSVWTVAGPALTVTYGVTSLTSYTFEIRARDSAGNLGSINSINFTTPEGIPNPPADAWASQGSQCHWNTWWNPPTSGSTPTYYRVRESGTGVEQNWTSQPATVNFPPCDNPSSNRPQWVKACNAQGCSTSRSVRIQ